MGAPDRVRRRRVIPNTPKPPAYEPQPDAAPQPVEEPQRQPEKVPA